MWIFYVLLFAGTVHLGIGVGEPCCEPSTSITAPINELNTISVKCSPGFTTACKWTVTAPPGTKIGVEISTVTIGAPSTIEYKNDAGNTITSFSGTSQSVPLRGAGQFFSVEINPDPGNMPPAMGEVLEFKYLAFSTPASGTTNACGSSAVETIALDTVSGGERCIASPNFPNFYPELTNCKWTIQTSDKIEYNIIFFHMEDSSPCDADFVKITAEGTTSDAQCSRQLQGVRKANLNSPVVVEFTSDGSDNFPGIFMCFKNLDVLTDDNDDGTLDVFVQLFILSIFVSFIGGFFFV